jgi:hypothetical protein
VGSREDGLRARLAAWSLFMDNDRTFKTANIDPNRDDIQAVLNAAICSKHKWVIFGLHEQAIYISIHLYDKTKYDGDLVVDDETTKYIVGRFTKDYNEFLLGGKPLPNEIMRVVSGDKLVEHLCDILTSKHNTVKTNVIQFKRK